MLNKLNFAVFSVMCLVACAFRPAFASEQEYAPIVIVNESVITPADLEERMNLVEFSMGEKLDQKTKSELRVAVLKEMIDERIKKQHVDKFAPKEGWASKEDVDNAFRNIAARNGVTEAQFRERLKSKHINPDALRNQIAQNVAWIEYVKAKFGNKTNISRAELERTLKFIKERLEQESFYVYRMSFPFSSSSDEKAVEAQVKNLYQILVNGADFRNVARQFSKGTDASNGGDIGWVFEGQLSAQEFAALQQMKVGSYRIVSNNKGFVILYLKDKKGKGLRSYTNMSFVEVIVPFRDKNPTKDQISATISYINEMKKASRGCSDFIRQAKADEFIQVSDKVTGVLEALQPKFRELIAETSAGKVSKPIVFDGGVAVFCVLDKSLNKVEVPKLDDIRLQKVENRLDAAARNELNFCRQKANVIIKDQRYANALGTLYSGNVLQH